MSDKNSKRVFRVQLEKDTMVFSAAHFITFNGNVCESIHGHNYAAVSYTHLTLPTILLV